MALCNFSECKGFKIQPKVKAIQMIDESDVDWYLKNIEMPGKGVIDHPGFTSENLGDQGKTSVRTVSVPEEIYVNIEDKLNKPKTLYKIGKKFGYRYTKIFGLPKRSEVSKSAFKKSTRKFLKYLESICYWSQGKSNIEYEKNMLNLSLEDFLVCNKNGSGNLFLGAAAGFWSYIVENKEVEAIQMNCQGRGDEECDIKVASRYELEDSFEAGMEKVDFGFSRDYKIFNQIRDTEYAESSMKDYEEIGFFEHRNGLFVHGNMRYIWTESSLIEILENELEDFGELLFGCAFQAGQNIPQDEAKKSMREFIIEYLSATGWGDTRVKKDDEGYQIESSMFPWTKFTSNTGYPIFRGMVSGIITKFKQREIKLKTIRKHDEGGTYTIVAEE